MESPPGSAERGPIALAIVLTDQRPNDLRVAILDAWRTWWKKRRCRSVDVTSSDAKADVCTFDVDGCTGVVSFMPFAVPDDVAQMAKQSWLWPDGVKRVRRHTAHVVVAVTGGPGTAARFAAATRLVAAVARAVDACGVYVGGAGMVVPAEIYADFADDFDPELPDLLWVDVPATVDDDGRASVVTCGLHAFGLAELEVVGSRREVGEVREFVLQVAGYLTENGPVIEDGDTVGGTETERYVAHFAPSVFDPTSEVMRIVGY